jgi:hypothetical protein
VELVCLLPLELKGKESFVNQDQVLDILQKTMAVDPMPKVIFSGKQSKKVNGIYHRESQEIIIHNRNFENDASLIFTAIHEYAHHIQVLATGKTGHNKQFWATVHALLDAATAIGVYQKQDYPESIGLRITELRKMLKDHAVLEAQIGDLLNHLGVDCSRKGVRIEPIIDRELKLKNTTAKRFMNSSKNLELFSDEDYLSSDMVSAVAHAPKNSRHEEADILTAGTSIYALTAPAQIIDDDMEEQLKYVKLAKSRDRLDRTIGKLTEERIRVEQEMLSIQAENSNKDRIDAGELVTP